MHLPRSRASAAGAVCWLIDFLHCYCNFNFASSFTNLQRLGLAGDGGADSLFSFLNRINITGIKEFQLNSQIEDKYIRIIRSQR